MTTFAAEVTDEQLNSAMEKTIKTMKGQLPQQIDIVTKLIDVEWDPQYKIFSYVYRIDYESSDFRASKWRYMQKELKEANIKSMCKMAKPIFKYGITLEMKYLTNDNKPVMFFLLNASDCQKKLDGI
jgi:hypothetical protein